VEHEFWKNESGIFLREGLDSESRIDIEREIRVMAHAFCWTRQAGEVVLDDISCAQNGLDLPDGSDCR
jgi:hypothetical protein